MGAKWLTTSAGGYANPSQDPQAAVDQTADLDKVQLMWLQLPPLQPCDLQHFTPNELGDDATDDCSDLIRQHMRQHLAPKLRC